MSDTKEQKPQPEKPIEHPSDKPNKEIPPPEFGSRREGLTPKPDKSFNDQIKKIIDDMDDK